MEVSTLVPFQTYQSHLLLHVLGPDLNLGDKRIFVFKTSGLICK